MKQYPAWGVDVTSVAVRGVKIATGAEGRPRLVAWDLVDFTEEVEDTTSLTRFAIMGRGLFHFLSRHSLKRSRVWISLRSETAFNRTVIVPPVNDESLDRILEYEAQQQVPHPLDDVFWDRRVLAIRENGEVLATLYAVRRALVEDRLRKLAKARFPVDGIQLRAIALQNFCAYERLLESGTIVVDVDYGGLQVLVHHEDQTWFRVLPVGGVDLIHRLKETFDCNHRTAVRMASGQAQIPDEDLYEACRREVAQDIVDEAVGTVRYFLAARPEVHPSGVVLFESHSCVPPLSSALKRSMDLPVFRPKGFRHIEVDPDVVTAGIQEHFAPLAKAAGLALQGVSRAEVDVRLYPTGMERNLDSRKTGYVVAALCLLAVILLAGLRRSAAAAELDDGSRQLATLLGSGSDGKVLERTIAPEEPLQQMEALTEPARGRLGALPAVAALYARLGVWDGGPRPRLVALRYSSADPGKMEVVLALQVGLKADGALVDPAAAMDAFIQSLAGQGPIEGASNGRQWESGRVTQEPIPEPQNRPLRYRFLHKQYTLQVRRAD